MKYLTVDSDNKILGWNEDTPFEGCVKTDASVPKEYAENTQSLYWEGSAIIARDDEKKIVRNAEKPMRLLRKKRNALLASSDWWASSDLVMSDERKAYRQALRDLPKGLTTPTKVKNVKWPTKP